MAPLRRFEAVVVAMKDDHYAYSENDLVSLVMEPEADGHTIGSDVRWVSNGSPSVGKSVNASMVSKLLNVPHISMSNLVRVELRVEPSLSKQGSTIYAFMSEDTALIKFKIPAINQSDLAFNRQIHHDRAYLTPLMENRNGRSTL